MEIEKENRTKFTSSKNLTDKEFENLKKELKRVEETSKIGKHPLLDYGVKFTPYLDQPKTDDFLKFIEKEFEIEQKQKERDLNLRTGLSTVNMERRKDNLPPVSRGHSIHSN